MIFRNKNDRFLNPTNSDFNLRKIAKFTRVIIELIIGGFGLNQIDFFIGVLEEPNNFLLVSSTINIRFEIACAFSMPYSLLVTHFFALYFYRLPLFRFPSLCELFPHVALTIKPLPATTESSHSNSGFLD